MNERSRVESHIRDSFNACKGWSYPSPHSINEKILEAANKEASENNIFCDDFGLTKGMSEVCSQFAKESLHNFNVCYCEFMTACAPHIKKIKKYSELEVRYQQIDDGIDGKISDEKAGITSTNKYVEMNKELEEARERYKRIRYKEGNRDVGLRPLWLYLLVLAVLGVGEIFLNYEFIFDFMEIPAFAFSGAAIVGFLMAWASHEHGIALKQYSHYFGKHVQPEDKTSLGWKFFVASSFLFLTFVGLYFVRFIAVANAQASVQAAAGIDILNLGSLELHGVGPHASALTSLMFNLAVWGSGVCVSYYFHDKNPDYIDAAKQKKRAEHKFCKLTKRHDANIKAYNASRSVEKDNVENELLALNEDLGEHLDLYNTLQDHRLKIIKGITNVTNQTLTIYQRALIGILKQNENTNIYAANGEIISRQHLVKHPFRVDEDYVVNLINW
ncbi:hypothetical protein [Maridesulfovibrio frigidus]|uniref:hypothetical protein n=1 Tax=Maridesulfovibrio frigidus TaxID=340956 RepID=UPI0004E1841B|nr:hypothetical protein [Maridesulfovibrio frigidus]